MLLEGLGFRVYPTLKKVDRSQGYRGARGHFPLEEATWVSPIFEEAVVMCIRCPPNTLEIFSKCSLHFLEVSHISMNGTSWHEAFPVCGFSSLFFLGRSPRKASIFCKLIDMIRTDGAEQHHHPITQMGPSSSPLLMQMGSLLLSPEKNSFKVQIYLMSF